MVSRVPTLNCCVAGCPRPVFVAASDDDGLCEDHAQSASAPLWSRFQSLSRRRERIERIWLDAARYETTIASGRYLRLCDVTQATILQAEDAWTRLKLDALRREGAKLAGMEASGRTERRRPSHSPP